MTKLQINPKFNELLDYLARMFKPVNNYDELDESDQKKVIGFADNIWRIVREKKN